MLEGKIKKMQSAKNGSLKKSGKINVSPRRDLSIIKNSREAIVTKNTENKKQMWSLQEIKHEYLSLQSGRSSPIRPYLSITF